MSFQSRVIAFSERFLSDHTFQLVVAPALADLEFDPGRTPALQIVNRLAVLKAVAGGLGDEVKRETGIFVALTLVPTCYYLCLVTVCLDPFSSWAKALAVAATIAALSLVPVAVCFWPTRRPMRDTD
ncbi:MAG: hypothetical protein ABI665_19665 [Vicinamibacterales bacterium]